MVNLIVDGKEIQAREGMTLLGACGKAGADKEIDANKNFCKYFILVVSWNNDQQLTQERKESDLIYLSVQRLS